MAYSKKEIKSSKKVGSYYPFGLKHKGYNNVINGTDHKYGYGGKEEQDELSLNLQDFHARQYDPALGRWTSIDPVTHFNMSTYNAFDNNPVYFADPSGTTTVSSIMEGFNASGSGKTTWNSNGEGGFCDDCPQEGEEKTTNYRKHKYEDSPGSGETTEFYHAGGVNNSKAGWYSQSEYYKKFSTIIDAIGQGYTSIEVLGNYNFTDAVLLNMASLAFQSSESYNALWSKPTPSNGAITPLYFTSPFFAPSAGLKYLQMSRVSKSAFWSGKGTQAAALNAGYKVLGQTRAGGNLIQLTSNMNYSIGSQAWQFWGRLSRAYASRIPKGSTVNVFVTRGNNANPMSIWSRFERPILEANKIKIKYNWID